MEHKEREKETERKRELNYISVEDSNRSLFKVNYWNGFLTEDGICDLKLVMLSF